MCTSFLMKTEEGGAYFGRNMDLYYDLDFRMAIAPRNYGFHWKNAGKSEKHYAILGAALVKDGFPLFCDAVNECGLAMAGLDFPKNAFYSSELSQDKKNISPFELIPFILSECKSVTDAVRVLEEINMVDIPFSEGLPLSPLHWFIADREVSVVFEATQKGQKIYEDIANVMTNNPPFDFHLANLSRYLNLFPENVRGSLAELGSEHISFGGGAVGLPGDLSSPSRFIRASFFLQNSKCKEENAPAQVFNILSAVSMPRGSVIANDGKYDITLYSSCIDLNSGIYYFCDYDNKNIRAVRISEKNINEDHIIEFPIFEKQSIKFLN